MNGCERVAICQHGQALDDRFFIMVFTVEDGASRFGHDLFASGTPVSLPPFARKSESKVFKN